MRHSAFPWKWSDSERPTHFLCLGSEEIKVVLGKSEKYERKNLSVVFTLTKPHFAICVLFLKTNVALSTLNWHVNSKNRRKASYKLQMWWISQEGEVPDLKWKCAED